MDYAIIIIVAFAASLLTFFSGFGLGTILLPVFALFFPLDVAIALTGVVHLMNNVFKLFLVGRFANKSILIRFGIPAIISAFIGAWVLIHIGGFQPLYQYYLGEQVHSITPVKIIIAILLIGFALIEILPAFRNIQFSTRWLPLGGMLSGFFGGLSGLQGAIRGAFLVKSALSKEAYIGTAAVLACFVDITRLSVYANGFLNTGLSGNMVLVLCAVAAALLGALTGKKLITKINYKRIQQLVAGMLVMIAIALAAGLI
jgi:hypothetical protein